MNSRSLYNGQGCQFSRRRRSHAPLRGGSDNCYLQLLIDHLEYRNILNTPAPSVGPAGPCCHVARSRSGYALQCARWPLGSRHVSCMCAWSVGVGLDDVNFLRIFYSAFVRTLIWTNNLSILSTSPSQWCSPNWHLRLFVIMLYFILYSLIFTCDQIYTKACGIC
jgi:hypothetical protein